jgi:hypothetical protein
MTALSWVGRQHRIYQALRAAVLTYYGRSCACCGATERLCIDHVNGNSREHLAQVGLTAGGRAFYRWLVEHDFPDDPPLQTLCLPCNSSKGNTTACRMHPQPLERAA